MSSTTLQVWPVQVEPREHPPHADGGGHQGAWPANRGVQVDKTMSARLSLVIIDFSVGQIFLLWCGTHWCNQWERWECWNKYFFTRISPGSNCNTFLDSFWARQEQPWHNCPRPPHPLQVKGAGDFLMGLCTICISLSIECRSSVYDDLFAALAQEVPRRWHGWTFQGRSFSNQRQLIIRS